MTHPRTAKNAFDERVVIRQTFPFMENDHFISQALGLKDVVSDHDDTHTLAFQPDEFIFNRLNMLPSKICSAFIK